ncbi:hypothetical protein ACFVJS_13005, partial [Nocardioides sp. NPDC057772]
MTEARTEILARVREALAGSAVELPEPPTPRDAAPLVTADVIELFAERVADYRAVVERCGIDEVEERVAAALPPGEVVVPPGGEATRWIQDRANEIIAGGLKEVR